MILSLRDVSPYPRLDRVAGRLMYEASGMAKRERPWDYRDAPLGTKESFEEMASAMSPSGRR